MPARLSIAELRSEFRRRIAGRPRGVVALVLVHGFILLQAALPNLLPGLAAAWGWSRFDSFSRGTPAAFFPSLGLTAIAWAISFAGLWYSKSWAWLLALFLDVTGILSGILGLSRWYSMRAAIPWAPLFAPFNFSVVALMLSEWLSFVLLFHFQVRQHYGALPQWVDSILNKSGKEVRELRDRAAGFFRPLLPGALVLDKITVRLIAASQLVFSLCWLLMIPFMFNYGGAAVHPNWFMGLLSYFFIGILSACALVFASTPARIFSLIWHSTAMGWILLGWILHGGVRWESLVNWELAWMLQVSFASFYLAANLTVRLIRWPHNGKWKLIVDALGLT